MKWKRPAAALLLTAAAAGGWVALNRPVTEADLTAVGLEADWRLDPYPVWWPKWIADRLPSRHEAVFVYRHPDAAWSPGAVAMLSRMAGLKSVDLSGSPATDADVRRLLRDHPALECLYLDDTAVTDAVLPALLRAGLIAASADAEGVTDGALLAAAGRRPGLLDGALARRAARAFVGGRADDAYRWPRSDEACWSGVMQDRRGRRRSDGCYRDRNYDGEGASAYFSWKPRGASPRRAPLPAESWRLLAAADSLTQLTMYGIADPPEVPPPLVSWNLLLEDCGVRWLAAGAAAEDLVLWEWRHGGAALTGRSFPNATEFNVQASRNDAEPLTGAFLNTIELPVCEELIVYGTATEPGEPLRVSAARFPKAKAFYLGRLALDGATLLDMAGGDRRLYLSELPNVTDADVAALLRRADWAGGSLDLEPGVAFGRESLRAALGEGGVTLSIDEDVLPPAADARAVLKETATAEAPRTIAVLTGVTPSASAELLAGREGVELVEKYDARD